jgi:hypothetical protein
MGEVAMPKIAGPFWVWKRPKTKKFQVALYPALPSPELCNNWKRKGFWPMINCENWAGNGECRQGSKQE